MRMAAELPGCNGCMAVNAVQAGALVVAADREWAGTHECL